jgi:hypothetical protein
MLVSLSVPDMGLDLLPLEYLAVYNLKIFPRVHGLAGPAEPYMKIGCPASLLQGNLADAV